MGELHERGGQRQGRPRGDAGRAPRLALVEGSHARPGAHVGGAVVHAGGHAVQGRAAWKESKGSWSQSICDIGSQLVTIGILMVL